MNKSQIATVWDAEFDCGFEALTEALREYLFRLRSGKIHPLAFGFIEITVGINFIDFKEDQYHDGSIYLLQIVRILNKKETRNNLGVFIVYRSNSQSTRIVLRCDLNVYASQHDQTVEIAKHFVNEAVGHGVKVKTYPKSTDFIREFTAITELYDLLMFLRQFNLGHRAFGYWIEIPENGINVPEKVTNKAVIILKTDGYTPDLMASRSPNWRYEIGVIDFLQINNKTRLTIYASNEEEREHFWAYINILKEEMKKFDLIDTLEREADNLINPSLRICLEEFALFIKTKKRMSFWHFDKSIKKHRWIPSPERHAKDLLETYLNGKFGQKLNSFQEINAGAGRVDLLVTTPSEEKAVIELKMCGEGYSTRYAKEGIDQLLHYMDNLCLKQGFLVVFDSRIRDFSKSFSPISGYDNFSIVTIMIDIRNKVK